MSNAHMLHDFDRDEIREAYPDGYLVHEGIGTLGGFRCVKVTAEHSVWWHEKGIATLKTNPHMDDDGLYERRSPWRVVASLTGDESDVEKLFRTAIDLGDLLPNPDPADLATRNCLLWDLAYATWPRAKLFTRKHTVLFTGPHYVPDSTPNYEWRLSVHSRRLEHRFPTLEGDPGAALIRARTIIRQMERSS